MAKLVFFFFLGEEYSAGNKTVNEDERCDFCLRHQGRKYEYFVRVKQKGNAGLTEGKPMKIGDFGFQCLQCGSHFSFSPIGKISSTACHIHSIHLVFLSKNCSHRSYFDYISGTNKRWTYYLFSKLNKYFLECTIFFY